jgi:two-component system invasion response regulator UvrY
MLRVLVVDDHPIFRQGVRQILEGTSDVIVAGEANDGEQALSMVKDGEYDIVLLDIALPGKSGLHIIEDLRSLKPGLPILVVTMHSEKQFAMKALKSGASGYLTKDQAPNELLEAIHRVSKGGSYISANMVYKLSHYLIDLGGDVPHESLSPREYEIMVMIAQGKSVSEIGNRLSLSVKTVSTHRSNILRKMKMRKNADLTLYALHNSLIDW